jgi:hypothetical protein
MTQALSRPPPGRTAPEHQLHRNRNTQPTSHFANHTMGQSGAKPAVIPRGYRQTNFGRAVERSGEVWDSCAAVDSDRAGQRAGWPGHGQSGLTAAMAGNGHSLRHHGAGTAQPRRRGGVPRPTRPGLLHSPHRGWFGVAGAGWRSDIAGPGGWRPSWRCLPAGGCGSRRPLPVLPRPAPAPPCDPTADLVVVGFTVERAQRVSVRGSPSGHPTPPPIRARDQRQEVSHKPRPVVRPVRGP